MTGGTVSFLNQLKSQASALQNQQTEEARNLDANSAKTNLACQSVWHYLGDLARQLNVIEPAGPKFSLDGRTYWPTMKLCDFRVDSRKKKLRDKEVYDYISMGWQIVPQSGAPIEGVVSVNFPPDLERVVKRLGFGGITYERKEQRHPEKDKPQAIVFEYQTQARGYLTVTADHDEAQLAFRLANANGFEIVNTSWPAERIQVELLDELAKLIVAQPSKFV
jgi:hypothetical protein